MTTFNVLCKISPGTLHSNVLIPDLTNGGFHPHKVDIYVPNGTVFAAAILLHGGSGTKENFAVNLKISTTNPPTVNTVNWSILSSWGVLIAIPQGQHCNGTVNAWNPNGVNTENAQNNFLGVPTWTNNVMWSQADDVAFCLDLRSYITSTYGLGGVSVCGHSNGGMMANRLWYEQPTHFSHFCCTSGPASNYYWNATPPSSGIVRPFFQQIGLLDDVLDVSGGTNGPGSHFYDNFWTANIAHLSVADVSYPHLSVYVSEAYQLAVRALAAGYTGSLTNGNPIPSGDAVVTNLTLVGGIGTQSEWIYTAPSGVTMQLQLLSAASHQISSHEQCTKRRVFHDWMNFIKTY